MKLNRTYLFIAASSLALIILLIIQVNWILQTAKIKEELFNEKANMVLSRTADALSADAETCKNMERCMGENEIHKIDSLFLHYMKFYNFHIDYSFQVVPPNAYTVQNKPEITANVYNKRLDEVVSKNGLELKLIFPKKEQFVIAEMGTMFITSVVLILVVLVMFWQTVLSLTKEKKIWEHTTEFLNNMTHEFKTPLTNIALAGKMILKGLNIKQEDKVKHYSGIILEENKKLQLQVEQVLSMTALERGEIPLHKTELDFHELIHEALKHIDIQLEHKHGSVKLNLHADRFVVMGDRTHLTNALRNLMDNAIKYCKKKPEITIETYNIDKNLIVVVADKGIGIKKEYQTKVFDKFFRVSTNDVHDVKGFGLGLAYIKKIVELHGGDIALTSGKEKGTTFTITLPNA
jgi:two-component system phosphate regulon sensor histidine kinase PhoR